MADERHSCYTCAGYGRRLGNAVWCAKSKYVNAAPLTGCAFWEREPGADDDGEPPIKIETWDEALARVRRERARGTQR